MQAVHVASVMIRCLGGCQMHASDGTEGTLQSKTVTDLIFRLRVLRQILFAKLVVPPLFSASKRGGGGWILTKLWISNVVNDPVSLFSLPYLLVHYRRALVVIVKVVANAIIPVALVNTLPILRTTLRRIPGAAMDPIGPTIAAVWRLRK